MSAPDEGERGSPGSVVGGAAALPARIEAGSRRLDRLESRGRRLGRLVLGDRVGLAVFLAVLAVLWLPWRIGVGALVTDTNAIANTLLAVADGRLAVTSLRYPLDALGSTDVQPGLAIHDGTVYGRNYGQAALALPVLWLLRGLAVLADPRLLLAAGWSTVFLALAVTVGRLTERDVAGRRLGAGLALAAFGVHLAVARPLDPRLLPVVALQATTLIAAAGTGALVYRLVGQFEGTGPGVAAGVATGLASPVAFWATVPKRHVLVGAFAVATVVAFAASRRSEERRSTGRRRALAYGLAGFVAWISAYDGFLLVAALAAVDLPTARWNGPRDLALVGAGALIGLGPAFATNLAISGDPFAAPRLLPAATPGRLRDAQVRVVSAAVGPAAAGSPLFAGGLGEVVAVLSRTVGGTLAALTDPGRLWHVFVRSGKIPGVYYHYLGYRIVELTVLESVPLLGALAAVPALVVGRVRRGLGDLQVGHPLRTLRDLPAARQTDLLAGAVAVAFVVGYLSLLPVHAQFTVRYLFPVYPLGLYGVARCPPVAATLREHGGRAAVAFVGTGALVLVAAAVLPASLAVATGEAAQLHALVDLGAAVGLAGLAVGRIAAPERIGAERVAVGLGVAGGLAAGYYLLAGLAHFRYGTLALGLADVVAGVWPIL